MRSRWLALAPLLTLAVTPAFAQDEDDEGWVEQRQVSLPLAHNARPLTLPEDMFDVFLDSGITQLSPQLVEVALGAGARYGVTDDLEVGVRLLRVTLSESRSSGLGRPTAFTQLRADLGAVELSGRFELELPTSAGPLVSWLSLPALVRAGPYVRLDVAPTLVARTGAAWQWALTTPVVLSGQVLPKLRIFVAGELGLPDLRTGRDLLLAVGGGAAWTFGGPRPSAELEARVTGPAVALAGERPDDPAYGNYFAGALTLRLFFAGPTDDWRRSPF